MTHAPEREDIKCPIAGGAPDCIKKTQIRNLRQEFLNSLSFLLSMLFRFFNSRRYMCYVYAPFRRSDRVKVRR